MIWVDQGLVFWLMAAIQVMGLFSMALARVGEHTAVSTPCRCVFLVCLLLVGCATMLSLVSGTGQWAASGITLSMMVVGCTLDLRGDARAAGWQRSGW